MDQRSRFITISELARMCGKSPDAIRKSADAGKIPIAMRLESGERLFSDVSAVIAGIEAHFGFKLQSVDLFGAQAIAKAIRETPVEKVADAYRAIAAYGLLSGSAGQMLIASAIHSVMSSSSDLTKAVRGR